MFKSLEIKMEMNVLEKESLKNIAHGSKIIVHSSKVMYHDLKVIVHRSETMKLCGWIQYDDLITDREVLRVH